MGTKFFSLWVGATGPDPPPLPYERGLATTRTVHYSPSKASTTFPTFNAPQLPSPILSSPEQHPHNNPAQPNTNLHSAPKTLPPKSTCTDTVYPPTLHRPQRLSPAVQNHSQISPLFQAKDVMQEIMKSFELPEPEDLQEAFDQIDANQDGKLTLEELTEAMKKDSGLAKVLLPSNLDLEGDPFGGACSVM